MTAVHHSLTIFAPAKLNLFLHVTGRDGNGYHMLQSLAAFADVGDTIRLEPAARFSFTVEGPFAAAFTAAEREGGMQSSNLAVRAARALVETARRDLLVHMTLVKNLPLAAGIGGGSADAAAVLWALLEWWDLAPDALPDLPALMLGLGADVPVCFASRPAMMEGIGDIVHPVPDLPEIPVVLVNPLKPCPTPQVFGQFALPFAPLTALPSDVLDVGTLISFLAAQDNMLTPAAAALVPDIAFVLGALESHTGCRLSRMSGSGATCFGLFGNAEDAAAAAFAIAARHPEWWVRAGTLNRPRRY